jgi:transcriptional regulator with XRE-family HTH domain
MSIDFYALGQRIQRKRKSQNKTQENLAEAISVTVGYVSQIERGITKINLETLSSIAEYLRCDITDFLSDTVKMSNNYLSEDFSDIIKKLNPSNRKILIEIAQVLEKSQVTISNF